MKNVFHLQGTVTSTFRVIIMDYNQVSIVNLVIGDDIIVISVHFDSTVVYGHF